MSDNNNDFNRASEGSRRLAQERLDKYGLVGGSEEWTKAKEVFKSYSGEEQAEEKNRKRSNPKRSSSSHHDDYEILLESLKSLLSKKTANSDLKYHNLVRQADRYRNMGNLRGAMQFIQGKITDFSRLPDRSENESSENVSKSFFEKLIGFFSLGFFIYKITSRYLSITGMIKKEALYFLQTTVYNAAHGTLDSGAERYNPGLLGICSEVLDNYYDTRYCTPQEYNVLRLLEKTISSLDFIVFSRDSGADTALSRTPLIWDDLNNPADVMKAFREFGKNALLTAQFRDIISDLLPRIAEKTGKDPLLRRSINDNLDLLLGSRIHDLAAIFASSEKNRVIDRETELWEYYRISRDEMNINTSRKDLTTRAFAENLSRHRALNKEAGELKERMQNQKKINQLLQEANTMFYRYDMKLTSEGSTDFDKEEIKKQSSQPFRYFSRRTDIFIELFGDYLEKKIPVNVVLPSKSSGVSQIEFASTVIAKLQKINLAGKYRQIGDLEFYSSVLKKAVLEKPFNIKPEDFRRMLCTTKEEKNHASEFFEYRSQIETVREMRNLIGIISNLIAEEIQNRKSNNPDLLSAQVSENKFQILFENKTATYGDLLRLGYALSLRIAYDLYHPAARAKYISDEDYEAEMNRIKNETEYLEPLAE